MIGAALNFVGGVLQRKQDKSEASKNRFFADAQAQRQMDFQKYMSDTAYQRAVADLKSAGLNPMLAYTQGGSSTPGGAMGSAAGAPGSPNLGQLATTGALAEQQKNTATAQEVAAISAGKQSVAQARLLKEQLALTAEKVAQEKRTTAMLKRKNITLPEIIYTPKHMLGSQKISANKQMFKSNAEKK